MLQNSKQICFKKIKNFKLLTTFFKIYPFIQRIKGSKYRIKQMNKIAKTKTIRMAMYLANVTRFRFSCEKKY